MTKSYTLLQEIQSLGGTESDLELLEGIRDTDLEDEKVLVEEIETNKKKKKNQPKTSVKDNDNLNDLQAALKSMISKSGLDLSKIAFNDVHEKDDDNDDFEEEEDNEPSLVGDFSDHEHSEIDGEDTTTLDQKSQEKYDFVLEKLKATLNEKSKKDNQKSLSKKLLVPVGSQWFSEELKPIHNTENKVGNMQSLLVKIYQKAKNLYEQEAEKYSAQSKSSNGSKDFISTVLKSGTVTDKVSAITLLIQESPFHTLDLLQKNLLNGMARKKARREALMALDSIKDLMITNLLPDRKLRYFRDQPWFAPSVSNKHLVLWFYEDALKKCYFEFIQVLEEFLLDPLQNIKIKALYYAHDCFMNKPEQEQNILILLVNKLGDQDKKITSKASHLLLKTLMAHPNMKLIITKEIEQLIFRPNVGKKTQYYCINVLNQIVLSKSDVDASTANHLITIYFTLFENLVNESKREISSKGSISPNSNTQKIKKKKAIDKKKKETKPINVQKDVDFKMMAAILTGVNRAFPFANLNDDNFDSKIEVLFKIAHMGTFNTCIQALSLIFQVQFSKQSVTDRYYRVIYESLLDPRLTHSSKHSMYLNLLYRSLKNDVSSERVKAFIKRLVQVCGKISTSFACASLFMISELTKAVPSIWGLILQPEDQEDEVFQDSKDNDEDEEKFVDVTDDEEKDEDRKKIENNLPISQSSIRFYDGRKREPLYANAGASCVWELVSFSKHFHPTLALYAQTLLSGDLIKPPPQSINYDPLQNHTIQRFLDRFVYKNPKKVDSAFKGSSLMQPRGVQGKTKDMIVAGGNKKRQVIVKDTDTGDIDRLDDQVITPGNYVGKEIDEVPVDEIFFHHYFNGKALEIANLKQKEKDRKMDEQDFSDDQSIEEDEIWQAISKSNDLPDELKVEDDEGDTDDDLNEIEYTDDSDQEEGFEEIDTEQRTENMEAFSEIDDDEEDDLQDFEEENDIINSDNEMAEFFNDEDEDEMDDDNNEGDDQKKGSKRPRRAIEKMSEKAKALGYSGDYFRKEASNSAFASADDFASLISYNNDEDEDVIDESIQRSKKKQRLKYRR